MYLGFYNMTLEALNILFHYSTITVNEAIVILRKVD